MFTATNVLMETRAQCVLLAMPHQLAPIALPGTLAQVALLVILDTFQELAEHATPAQQ